VFDAFIDDIKVSYFLRLDLRGNPNESSLFL
jgi:hypothetical protein